MLRRRQRVLTRNGHGGPSVPALYDKPYVNAPSRCSNRLVSRAGGHSHITRVNGAEHRKEKGVQPPIDKQLNTIQGALTECRELELVQGENGHGRTHSAAWLDAGVRLPEYRGRIVFRLNAPSSLLEESPREDEAGPGRPISQYGINNT